MADVKSGLLLSDKLIAWYEINKRDLPWRHSSDPYLIWVSEVILQQTRVAQGLDYFNRFVGRFPDVRSLAAASEDEVLRYWQGLGYYSRARNLHAAAQYVVEQYGGEFPKNYVAVRTLKGVGDYTAAAIVSFAWNLPYAVVDGNAYRVLARLFAEATPIDTSQGRKLFSELAAMILPEDRACLHNQAIMELGALVCTPRNPSCTNCPLSDICLAHARKNPEAFPVKLGRMKSRDRYFHYFHIRYKGKTYIRKRGDGDIWQGLYEFPMVESETFTDWANLPQKAVGQIFEGCGTVEIQHVSPTIKHVLSHQVLYADCYHIEVEQEGHLAKNFLRIDAEDLDLYALPRLVSKLLSF